ncbi:hypothetical protein DFR50_15122 [Roseiarcus fermentans]|uniref:Uncharacterized protein n=1 Tax=Roseiarcus fermentans TaxID=1473586 RepID=A0A366EKQ9_9HYPH|nr:hypothetical protein [Roseiarcus fermentans]RBP02546.1 hypothetical protein DFR50_15122 [Roseiarcus fermentans]
MTSMRVLAIAAALTSLSPAAYANDASRCVDVSVPRKAVEAGKGQWIELTADQWEFLRGVYAMNPLTPPGLPYGDKAALARVEGNDGGLVFFLDGNLACTPMAAPKALLALLDAVATATIAHEGSGL